MRERLRPFAFVLAFTAMLLRGLLPAGWMPASDGSGPIVICTGHGPVRGAPLKQSGHTLPQRGVQLCAFASAAHLSPPQAQVLAFVPAPTGRMLVTVPDRSLVSGISIHRPQSPRAPPILA